MPARHALPTAPAQGFRQAGVIERAGEQFRAAALSPAMRAQLKRLYHGALMLQSGGRGLRCTLPGGEVVRTLPAHRYLSWNDAEYAAFRAATPNGGVAIDVGANVGAYTLLFGQWVGPRGRVVAFEPQPEIFAGLSAHVRLNHLDAVVTPVMAAVGDRETTADLVVSGTAGESRLAGTLADGTSRFASSDETLSTTLVTLDRYCAREGLRPDVIKVDVEGWELAVLRGARGLLERHPAIALFVEMHPSIWPLLGISREDVLAELAAQQLVIEPLSPAADVWALEGVCVRVRRASCAS